MSQEISEEKRKQVFPNDGEMGQLISRFDWGKTKIGTVDSWPQSLRTTVNNLLHSSFPMFLFWGEDLICFYNDAFRPSLGIDGKHPAIGKSGREVWAETWHFIGPLIDQVLTTGRPTWFENQLVPFYRNGSIEDIYWTFSYSPAFNDDNEINGVLVTCIETTQNVLTSKRYEEHANEQSRELEKAHGSLIQANIYLQQIINSFREPLQVLEPITENGEIIDFRFKLTNAAYSAYANATPEQLYNKRVGDVFPGYFKTSSFSTVVKTCVSGIPNTWEIHYDQDGLDLYNEMSATKLGDQVIVHFTNFTKLKHLQLELIKKIEELERSNRNLEEFAHAASHDLKEPLRKIRIFTGTLKSKLKGHLSETESGIFSKIETATERMLQLIEDLIQYSHVSLQPVQKEVVNLNLKIQQVLEDLELDIQQKNAVVKLQDLPHVKGYGRQLQQLFQNLISNSLKYCRAEVRPEINISTGRKDEAGKRYVVIDVKDNGIGFDQQFSGKIFEMFTRLHGKSEYKGNGIGLSIVKKIVDNHQGEIRVESAPGQGSLFSVHLPAD